MRGERTKKKTPLKEGRIFAKISSATAKHQVIYYAPPEVQSRALPYCRQSCIHEDPFQRLVSFVPFPWLSTSSPRGRGTSSPQHRFWGTPCKKTTPPDFLRRELGGVGNFVPEPVGAPLARTWHCEACATAINRGRQHRFRDTARTQQQNNGCLYRNQLKNAGAGRVNGTHAFRDAGTAL